MPRAIVECIPNFSEARRPEVVEAIIAEARKMGYAYMRGDTISSMKVAYHLYKSLGFYEIEAYRYNPLEGAIFLELKLV